MYMYIPVANQIVTPTNSDCLVLHVIAFMLQPLFFPVDSVASEADDISHTDNEEDENLDADNYNSAGEEIEEEEFDESHIEDRPYNQGTEHRERMRTYVCTVRTKIKCAYIIPDLKSGQSPSVLERSGADQRWLAIVMWAHNERDSYGFSIDVAVLASHTSMGKDREALAAFSQDRDGPLQLISVDLSLGNYATVDRQRLWVIDSSSGWSTAALDGWQQI